MKLFIAWWVVFQHVSQDYKNFKKKKEKRQYLDHQNNDLVT